MGNVATTGRFATGQWLLEPETSNFMIIAAFLPAKQVRRQGGIGSSTKVHFTTTTRLPTDVLCTCYGQNIRCWGSFDASGVETVSRDSCQILHAYKLCIPMPDGDSSMRVGTKAIEPSMVSMKNLPSQLTLHVYACLRTGLFKCLHATLAFLPKVPVMSSSQPKLATAPSQK